MHSFGHAERVGHLIHQPEPRADVSDVSRFWEIPCRLQVATALSHVSHVDREACKVHCGCAEDELLWVEDDSISAIYIQPLGRLEVAPLDHIYRSSVVFTQLVLSPMSATISWYLRVLPSPDSIHPCGVDGCR